MKLTIRIMFWMYIGHIKEWINTKKDLKTIYVPPFSPSLHFSPIKIKPVVMYCLYYMYIKTTQQKMRELVISVIFVQLQLSFMFFYLGNSQIFKLYKNHRN